MADIKRKIIKPRFLVSYAYMNDRVFNLVKENKEDFDVLLDSGAFTAHTTGRSIVLDEYLTCVRRFEDAGVQLAGYFTLDVIGDAARTRENYDEALAQGFNPIPIFTRGAAESELHALYEQSDIVALGGVAVLGMRARPYVKAVMDNLIVPYKRKVHWLGWRFPAFVNHYKPYQLDSSDLTRGFRYGTIILMQGAHSIAIQHKNIASALANPRVRTWLTSYNIDPDELRHREAWHGNHCLCCYLTALTRLEYSIELERRGITRMYHATSMYFHIEQMVKAYKQIKLKEQA